jgi:hypothetical protein
VAIRGPVRADGRSGDPTDLSERGLHCYSPTARRTPHTIVAEGSNGRLLFEARAGASRQMLEASGVPVTDEQVARLAEFGLLDVHGDVLRTAFPALGTGETTELRRRARTLGGALAGRLVPLVAALRSRLDRMDLVSSTYAVVFGYALDGLLWDRLAMREMVPDTTLPSTTAARLAALASASGLPDVVHGLLDAAAATGASQVVDDTGVTWSFRRQDGRAAIPVVGAGGPPDEIAGHMADIVADAVAGDDTAAARAAVPCDDVAVATVIVVHELIWDITEALIASRSVEPVPSPTTSHTAPIDLLFVQLHDGAST